MSVLLGFSEIEEKAEVLALSLRAVPSHELAGERLARESCVEILELIRAMARNLAGNTGR